MKRFFSSITLAALAVSSAVAADFVGVSKVSDDLSKVNATSAILGKLKFEEVALYPQLTVDNNDAEATKKMVGAQPMKAKVAAVQNGKQLLVAVKYSDATQSKQLFKSTKSFGDAVAVQFPQSCGSVETLPYIGMGSDGRPVEIYLQKNVEKVYLEPNAKGDVRSQQVRQNLNLFGDELAKHEKAIAAAASNKYQKVFVSEGFRSMTEAKEIKSSMDMAYAKGGYTAVFVKDLDGGACDAIPVALAIWDGNKDGRNGSKWLSGWTPLKIADSEKSKADIAKINEKVKGDAVKGKALAVQNCGACHTMGDAKATPYMAPDLSSIGGQATVAYLKESIVNPSAVVVPGYNANAHPSNQWYSVVDGKRVSMMPAFDYLKPEEINDIVAYIQTLKSQKSTVKAGGKR